jgi:hypothetical protein
MRNLVVLFIHFIAILARLLGPASGRPWRLGFLLRQFHFGFANHFVFFSLFSFRFIKTSANKTVSAPTNHHCQPFR